MNDRSQNTTGAPYLDILNHIIDVCEPGGRSVVVWSQVKHHRNAWEEGWKHKFSKPHLDLSTNDKKEL